MSDIMSLCAALDTCPDEDIAHVLALLADALEEQGDPRAEHLRHASLALPRGNSWIRSWWRSAPSIQVRGPFVSWTVFARLAGGEGVLMGWKCYPTRSAAFLALAEALAS